jgi:hypothetical protein
MAEMEIINRVAASSLIQLSPEDWYDVRPRFSLDLADYLFQGLVLKELDFRSAMKTHDWEKYRGGILCIFCSADAIVPVWAFMLISVHATAFDVQVEFCEPSELDAILYDRVIQNLNPEDFANRKVIIKGCSKHPVPELAFVRLAGRLRPVVQSLMFGEPCSSVPLFKVSK